MEMSEITEFHHPVNLTKVGLSLRHTRTHTHTPCMQTYLVGVAQRVFGNYHVSQLHAPSRSLTHCKCMHTMTGRESMMCVSGMQNCPLRYTNGFTVWHLAHKYLCPKELCLMSGSSCCVHWMCVWVCVGSAQPSTGGFWHQNWYDPWIIYEFSVSSSLIWSDKWKQFHGQHWVCVFAHMRACTHYS